MAATKSLNKITLKGSAAMVSEFFYFGINSILYQRGVYPAEMFRPEKKYGLTTFVTTDKDVLKYLNQSVTPQLTEWLERGVVKRLVLVVKEIESQEVLERWQFEIQCDKKAAEDDTKNCKNIAEIHKEIKAIIRQITATVTFLPLLDSPCSFDLLFYTNKEDVEVPEAMRESGACLITNAEQVKLRSFSTNVHSVEGAVSYKFVM